MKDAKKYILATVIYVAIFLIVSVLFTIFGDIQTFRAGFFVGVLSISGYYLTMEVLK